MKKGKGRFLAMLWLVLLLMTFLLSPVLAASDVDLLILELVPVGPGPPIVVLVLIGLGVGIVVVTIVYPSAPPYGIGGFFGSLDLNNTTSLNNTNMMKTLGTSNKWTRAKNAVTAGKLIIYPT